MPANHAISIIADGQAKIQETEIPALPADDYIVVKVKAVALNPTDWKHIDGATAMGCLGTNVGCDYAGEVLEVGKWVTKKFEKGDRITGPVNGGNAFRHIDGSFAEYIVVKGDLQIKIPENITNEHAATLGIAVTTVGQGLYQALGLPLPTSPATDSPSILIYGGATAMGSLGIQYAVLSGYTVYTTCSPGNFSLVRNLGAHHVFDYHDPLAAEAIRTVSHDSIRVAWDTVTTPDTGAFCAAAMSSQGGKYSALLPGSEGAVKGVNEKIETAITLYYSAFGERYKMYAELPVSPENYEFAKMFWNLAGKLLAEGKLRATPIDVNRGGGGLEGVLKGLDEMRKGKVRATKLVYAL